MDENKTIPEQPVSVHVTVEKNGMATAGFVMGILAFILSWIPLIGISIGWVLGVLAIIFGGVGISKSGKVHVGKGLAIAALVLGIITVIFKSIPVFNLL